MRTLSVLLAAVGIATPAWAGDLQGTWVVDLKASDSLAPLLEAQGVSWMKRKAANGMKVTQTIARDGDRVTLTVVSSASTREETLLVDEKTRTVEGERGTARVHHRWDGDALVTVQEGETGVVTTRRHASDDGTTMTQTITLEKAGAEPVTVDRIFRKP